MIRSPTWHRPCERRWDTLRSLNPVAGERPTASSEQVHRRMRLQRRRDTGLEIAYRRALFSYGLRYRVDHRLAPLRRRADIAFTRWRVAVFLDGCFWHACPLHATLPKTNRNWWRDKLQSNASRDRDTETLLVSQGWRVVRLWEHEKLPVGLEKILTALVSAGMPRIHSHSGDLTEQ